MALNFLGLGFSFGAEDKGLLQHQKKVAQGFTGIDRQLIQAADSIDSLADSFEKDFGSASRSAGKDFANAARDIDRRTTEIGLGFGFVRDMMGKMDELIRQNRLGNFLSAMSAGVLDDIANKFGEITKQGGELTTGLEAEMVANGKTARQMGANFGYAGAELNKFASEASSIAIALNIDAGASAKAVRAWTEAHEELGAVGFKSAKDVARVADTFGVEADALRDSVLQMKNMGLSGKQINKVSQSLFHMGKTTGDVGAALGELPEQMARMSKVAEKMGLKLDGAELAKFATDTAALGSAFFSFGENADVARARASSIADALLEARGSMKDLLSGTGDDFPAFAEEIGIAFGDVNQALTMMEQSPADFVMGLTKAMQGARDSGKLTDKQFQAMSSRFSKGLGGDAGEALTRMVQSATSKTFGMMKATAGATKGLVELGKAGHTTGRTLQERFDLIRDSAVMRFRQSGNAGSEFVSGFAKQAGAFNDAADKMSSKGGPLGAIVDKMREMHVIGVKALLPKTLQPMAAIMGEVGNQAAPMITAMGAMGLKFGMLLNPIGLVIAAFTVLGVWFADLKMQGKSTGEAFEIMGSKIKETWNKVVSFLKSVDWKGIFDSIKGAVRTAFEALADFDWKGTAKTVLELLGKALVQSNQLLNKALKTLTDALDFEAIFSAIFKGFSKVGEALAGPEVEKFLRTLATEFVKRYEIIGTALVTVIGKALEFLKKVDFSSASGSVLDSMAQFGSGVADKVIAALGKIGEKIPGVFSKLVPILVGALKDAPAKIVSTLKELGPKIREMLEGLGPKLKGVMSGLGAKLKESIKTLIPTLLTGAADLLGALVVFLAEVDWGQLFVDLFIELPNAIIGFLLDVVKGIALFLADVGTGITDLLLDILSGIGEGLLAFIDEAFPGFFEELGEFIVGIGDYFEELIDSIGDMWKAFKMRTAAVLGSFAMFVKGIVDGLVKKWEGFKKALMGIWSSVKTAGEEVITTFTTKFDKLSVDIKATFTQIKDSIVTSLTDAKTAFVGVFDTLLVQLKAVWTRITEFLKPTEGKGGVKGFFSGLFSGAGEWMKAGLDSMFGAIKKVYNRVTRLWIGLKSFFSTLFKGIGEMISNAMRGVIGKLEKASKPITLAIEALEKILIVQGIIDDPKKKKKGKGKGTGGGGDELRSPLASLGADHMGAGLLGVGQDQLGELRGIRRGIGGLGGGRAGPRGTRVGRMVTG